MSQLKRGPFRSIGNYVVPSKESPDYAPRGRSSIATCELGSSGDVHACRIAECLTACEGRNPKAFPALLAACESMADAWESYLKNPDEIGVDIEAEINEAREAIALATYNI